MKNQKSRGLALLLSFFFGPLGMFYATVPGAVVMFFVNLAAIFFTAGFGLLVTIPAGMLWSWMAVEKFNEGQSA